MPGYKEFAGPEKGKPTESRKSAICSSASSRREVSQSHRVKESQTHGAMGIRLGVVTGVGGVLSGEELTQGCRCQGRGGQPLPQRHHRGGGRLPGQLQVTGGHTCHSQAASLGEGGGGVCLQVLKRGRCCA